MKRKKRLVVENSFLPISCRSLFIVVESESEYAVKVLEESKWKKRIITFFAAGWMLLVRVFCEQNSRGGKQDEREVRER